MTTPCTYKTIEEISIKTLTSININMSNQNEMNMNKLVEKHDFGWKVIGGRVY